MEELLASEVVYYDRLRTVFHTYANPLRYRTTDCTREVVHAARLVRERLLNPPQALHDFTVKKDRILTSCFLSIFSKWGLTGKDHDMLFAGLDELLNLVESFIRQV